MFNLCLVGDKDILTEHIVSGFIVTNRWDNFKLYKTEHQPKKHL